MCFEAEGIGEYLREQQETLIGGYRSSELEWRRVMKRRMANTVSYICSSYNTAQVKCCFKVSCFRVAHI